MNEKVLKMNSKSQREKVISKQGNMLKITNKYQKSVKNKQVAGFIEDIS
jgi:hypothetical protein